MKIITSYDTKIMNSIDENGVIVSLNKKVLNDTLSECRRALAFIISVANEHFSEWKDLNSQEKCNFVEKLIHNTENNKAVCDFDLQFKKFPSYLRRSAVSKAIGIVDSYHSNLDNWKKSGKKGSEPKLNTNHFWDVSFYRSAGGDIQVNGYMTVNLRVFQQNDWKWMPLLLKGTDVSYIERHCLNKKGLSPSLKKVHGEYYFTWAFEERKDLVGGNALDYKICAVDMGVLTDATCSIMDSEGTVYARKFIRCAYEKDQLNHLLNRIKRNQKNKQSVKKLWVYAKNFNTEISRKTANAIIDFAIENDASCIVFEYLDTTGRKHGPRKQRLQHWKHREIQQLVELKAHHFGLHISHVCAWGTSKLAFDGSREVKRGKQISENTPYDICQFSTGKVYNCDLNASYNIGARYFLREFERLEMGYDLSSTPKRTLSDLKKQNSAMWLL